MTHKIIIVDMFDQRSYYFLRKAGRFTAIVLLMVFVQLASTGCVQVGSGWERTYTPSPSGKLTASLITGSTDILVPAEGITLSEFARFRLRGQDGSILKTINLEEVEGVSPSSKIQLLWSSDEKYVACHALGTFWIINISAGTKHRLESQEISSIRWKDESTLVYVEKLSKQFGDLSKQSVYTLSLPAHKITLLLEVGARTPFHSLNFNQLSPNTERLIYYKEGTMGVASTKEGRVLGEYPVNSELNKVWWNKKGEYCVVSAGFNKQIWLYDDNKNSLTKITAQLKGLSGNTAVTPKSSKVRKIWSPDGIWYLTSEIGTRTYDNGSKLKSSNKDWIHFVEDGSAICIQNEIGAEFWSLSLSPTGDFLTLVKRPIGSSSNRELYACSLKTELGRKITFGQPKKIYSGRYFSSNFWSIDGERHFIIRSNDLVSISKEQMQ